MKKASDFNNKTIKAMLREMNRFIYDSEVSYQELGSKVLHTIKSYATLEDVTSKDSDMGILIEQANRLLSVSTNRPDSFSFSLLDIFEYLIRKYGLLAEFPDHPATAAFDTAPRDIIKLYGNDDYSPMSRKLLSENDFYLVRTDYNGDASAALGRIEEEGVEASELRPIDNKGASFVIIDGHKYAVMVRESCKHISSTASNNLGSTIGSAPSSTLLQEERYAAVITYKYLADYFCTVKDIAGLKLLSELVDASTDSFTADPWFAIHEYLVDSISEALENDKRSERDEWFAHNVDDKVIFCKKYKEMSTKLTRKSKELWKCDECDGDHYVD